MIKPSVIFYSLRPDDDITLRLRKPKYFRALHSESISSKTNHNPIKYVSNLAATPDLHKTYHFAKTVRRISPPHYTPSDSLTSSSCFGLHKYEFLLFTNIKQFNPRLLFSTLPVMFMDIQKFQCWSEGFSFIGEAASFDNINMPKNNLRFWFKIVNKFEITFQDLFCRVGGLVLKMNFRLSPIQVNDALGKPFTWWQITGAEFSFLRGKYSAEDPSFLNFIKKMTQLKSLHLNIKKTQLESLHNLVPLFSDIPLLRHLTIICEGLNLTTEDFITLQFPKNLTSLCLRIGQGPLPQNTDDLMELSHFGRKIRELTELRTLDLAFPTTIYINQMVHNMPGTLTKLENLRLAFVEENEKNGFEEFYVNSCLEWIMSMPELKNFSLRSNRLNYTYCSFLTKEDLPKKIEKIEWVDECLSNVLKPGKEDFSNEMWIECKKNEDINIVLGIVSSKETRHFEMPMVFDVLPAYNVLEKLVELVPQMENLEKAVFAVGFKLLEPKDIVAVEEMLKTIMGSLGERRLDRVKINVYFRELSGEISTDLKVFERQVSERWPGCEIRYIYSRY